MLFRIKVTYNSTSLIGDGKTVSEFYLTDDKNFAYAGLKILKILGNKIDVEEIKMLKEYKPPINEYTDGNKVYIIKVAEDYIDENGNPKTLKYPMPAFANNDAELYEVVKNFLAQGLQNMRLTTISETKWKYIK